MIADISYLILNYNPAGEAVAQKVLGAAIESLYTRKSRCLRSEVLLLDQGTTRDHRHWLVQMQEQYGFSAILLNRNIGISGAVNFFVRTTRSPVVALITSDVVITQGMDEDLFRKVEIAEVYQATPFTDRSDLDYQTWLPDEPFGSETVNLEPLKRKQRGWLANVLERPQARYLRCIGTELNVIFWPRRAFDRIGYFDERWRACHEINDFSLRCFLDGGCTAVSSDSFVWHHHHMTSKSGAVAQVYPSSRWPEEMRARWDQKWPQIDSYIDIYKPLKNKTIDHFKEFGERFHHNLFQPFEQVPG